MSAAAPRVSVVVPNYNYAALLPERMRSILAQTRRDFEVILLDDASTDDSVAVLEQYVDPPRVRLVRNAENGGNPFRQWARGIALARGAYVWMAEADDSADPRLLARCAGVLDAHPNVGLVHCAFRRLDARGVAEDLSGVWWRDLDAERWRRDHVAPGAEELRWLACWNVISSASGVVFRRAVYDAAGGVDPSFRLAGDWDLWVRMARLADVGFVAEPLNLWRWHGGSVRATAARSGEEQREVERVLAGLARASGAAPETLLASYHRRHAESALRWRNAPLARKHAAALLRRRPLDGDTWRILLRSGLLLARTGLRPSRAG
ncbi:MAG: glycosyltransferase [bacterium]|nr:glycosyltransferase [bacterium]